MGSLRLSGGRGSCAFSEPVGLFTCDVLIPLRPAGRVASECRRYPRQSANEDRAPKRRIAKKHVTKAAKHGSGSKLHLPFGAAACVGGTWWVGASTCGAVHVYLRELALLVYGMNAAVVVAPGRHPYRPLRLVLNLGDQVVWRPIGYDMFRVWSWEKLARMSFDHIREGAQVQGLRVDESATKKEKECVYDRRKSVQGQERGPKLEISQATDAPGSGREHGRGRLLDEITSRPIYRA